MTTMVKRCEAMMVPLRDWQVGWLTMEVATLSHHPEYPLIHDQEKRSKELPVTREEMIAYITGEDGGTIVTIGQWKNVALGTMGFRPFMTWR